MIVFVPYTKPEFIMCNIVMNGGKDAEATNLGFWTCNGFVPVI